jgi:hypothetical protein
MLDRPEEPHEIQHWIERVPGVRRRIGWRHRGR